MQNLERRELSESAPQALIETLKGMNEELACGLIVMMPTRDGQYVAILSYQFDDSYYSDYGKYYRRHIGFGVHPRRGLIMMIGGMTEPIRDFCQKAMEENSIYQPSPMIFVENFEDLADKSGLDSVINLASVDDETNIFSDLRPTWKQCFNSSFEIATAHKEFSDHRLNRIRQMLAV